MHPLWACTLWGTTVACSLTSSGPASLFSTLDSWENRICLHQSANKLQTQESKNHSLKGKLICATNYFFKWRSCEFPKHWWFQLGEIRHRSLSTKCHLRIRFEGEGAVSNSERPFCLLRTWINAFFLELLFPKVKDFRPLILRDEVLTISEQVLRIGHFFYSDYFHSHVLSLHQKDVLFPSKETGSTNGGGVVRVEVELTCLCFRSLVFISL